MKLNKNETIRYKKLRSIDENIAEEKADQQNIVESKAEEKTNQRNIVERIAEEKTNERHIVESIANRKKDNLEINDLILMCHFIIFIFYHYLISNKQIIIL